MVRDLVVIVVVVVVVVVIVVVVVVVVVVATVAAVVVVYQFFFGHAACPNGHARDNFSSLQETLLYLLGLRHLSVCGVILELFIYISSIN